MGLPACPDDHEVAPDLVVTLREVVKESVHEGRPAFVSNVPGTCISIS